MIAALAAGTAWAQAGEFDGTWTGRWDNEPASQITVKDDMVTRYVQRGRMQHVGKTSVSGKTLSFGQGYKVRLTMVDAGTANGSYSGRGTSKGTFTRK